MVTYQPRYFADSPGTFVTRESNMIVLALESHAASRAVSEELILSSSLTSAVRLQAAS